MAQSTKILELLATGNAFTPAQLANSIGSNPHSVRSLVSKLRQDGNCIYTNVAKNGNKTYRLGKPSRSIVAAAAKAFGGSIFSTAE